MNLVIEYHYDDGDVGAHPADEAEHELWDGFSKNTDHTPTHIVIRPDTDEGQELSNKLWSSEDLYAACVKMQEDWGKRNLTAAVQQIGKAVSKAKEGVEELSHE